MKITGKWLSVEPTQRICKILSSAGFTALFVGGCVRNALLGVPVNDIDIATDANPDTVLKLALAAGLKAIPTGIDHGTVTVISDGTPYEITTFRKDVETFGRRAVVAYSTDIQDDARRRDFTMNALYAHADGTVVDPLGGLQDLKDRRFRFIEDAVRRIQEDYLRILRFFRFNAWYGLPDAGLDPDALAAIGDNLDGLKHLSRERVGSEVLKLLSASDPGFAVAAMRTSGVLNAILPGADDRVLGPLLHLETQANIEPDAIRRLAILGGEGVVDRLRLSTEQAKTLHLLRDMIGSAMPPGEMGYRYGATLARDAILLRSVVFETALRSADMEQIALGAAAKLPVKAADFQPAYEGPALGKALKDAETLWITSGFTLDRKALIERVSGE